MEGKLYGDGDVYVIGDRLTGASFQMGKMSLDEEIGWWNVPAESVEIEDARHATIAQAYVTDFLSDVGTGDNVWIKVTTSAGTAQYTCTSQYDG